MRSISNGRLRLQEAQTSLSRSVRRFLIELVQRNVHVYATKFNLKPTFGKMPKRFNNHHRACTNMKFVFLLPSQKLDSLRLQSCSVEIICIFFVTTAINKTRSWRVRGGRISGGGWPGGLQRAGVSVSVGTQPGSKAGLWGLVAVRTAGVRAQRAGRGGAGWLTHLMTRIWEYPEWRSDYYAG